MDGLDLLTFLSARDFSISLSFTAGLNIFLIKTRTQKFHAIFSIKNPSGFRNYGLLHIHL